MNIFRRNWFHLAGLTIVFSCVVAGATPNDVTKPEIDTRMCGTWELSPEFNQLLGFKDEDTRSDPVDHPLSFSIAVDKKLAASIGDEDFKQFHEEVFRPMGQQVVATGQWKTTFLSEPGIETACFITRKIGKTYIWVAAPFSVLYGGQLSYISGADKKRDVLVLDFNFRRNERTPSSVAYRRTIE